MFKKLPTDVARFTHILHIADIHIRLNRRHDEYREVFNKLYKAVEGSPPETVVAVLGDVFHNKSDLSPEGVQMATDFFNRLSDLRPTILIAGNHDATLSNKNRLDSLTPIVDALKHPRLYYLKDTGLYGFGNILFNNMGVFDPPEKYIRGKDIPAIYRNQYDHVVALFHGAVDRAALETGYSITNPSIMTPLFDNNDIALLGDIHKKQDMQQYNPQEDKPCIHYPGSMIQQTHGEGLKGHGYSLWDLATRTYEFTELPNDYGYFTVEIHKGQLVTDLADLPKKPRLRAICFETIPTEVKKIIAGIRAKADVAEVTYVRKDKEKKDEDLICKDILLNDLSNVEYQGKLLREFLTQKLEITDTQKIDDVLDLNRLVNSIAKKDEFARNLKWKPIRFEWSNMFTYGEDNVIDFTKMDGAYGIFGPNRCGKSSILSAITFCLFDKFDRGFKGLHVRNVEKTTFHCKLEFEIAGVHYFIERDGETTRSGNVKVDVNFWKVENGVAVELHGTARRATNDIIRDYVGTYEDFILTTLSIQSAKNNASFIDMGNTERKDLLVQFIGLNVFDRLHEAASTRNKELNAVLKMHKDKNYAFERQEHSNSLAQATSVFNQQHSVVEDLRKQMVEINEQILTESSKLIKLEDEVPTDLEGLTTRKDAIDIQVRQTTKQIEDLTNGLEQKKAKVAEFDKAIEEIEKSDLVESHKIFKKLTDRIVEVKQEIELKKVEVRGRLEKVERLKTHEYDPNCKYCVNNEFVKDAMAAKTQLVEDKQDTDKMMQTLRSLTDEIAKYQWVEEAYQKYTTLLTDRSNVKDELSNLNHRLIVIKMDLEKKLGVQQQITKEIELYHRNEVSVQHNVKIHSNISAFKESLSKVDGEFQRHNRALMETNEKIGNYRGKISELTKILEEIEELEAERETYQNYMAAVGRDGIPYQVISNTVPAIENEVNSILSQVVDYTIEFETDGKNIIPSIVYDQRKWPIEMSSGFERFVASVAIRVALTNISNLPKTTFLALDEGFGTLDPENLASMFTLFSFLKNSYDFMLIVSHLDALKDAVDHQIEIKKEGNFSKVVFE